MGRDDRVNRSVCLIEVVNGRMWVVYDPVAVGKKSCTSLRSYLVELKSGNSGSRDDRVD